MREWEIDSAYKRKLIGVPDATIVQIACSQYIVVVRFFFDSKYGAFIYTQKSVFSIHPFPGLTVILVKSGLSMCSYTQVWEKKNFSTWTLVVSV